MKRAQRFLVGLVVLIFAAGLLAVPTSAAKYGASASISTSRKTCEVTATVTWRMEFADEVKIAVWETYPGYTAIATNLDSSPANRGRLSVSTIGVPGRTYQAVANVAGTPGASSASKLVTLNCSA